MALKAGNEVVGGNTLRRAAIESPNFVTGVSGWIIRQDGSAEFNNVVIRGGQIVSGTALFYSGTPALGNLVASVSAAAGTDSAGNAYLAGIASYLGGASFSAVSSNGGVVTFWTSPVAGGPWTSRASVAGDATGDLLLRAPSVAASVIATAPTQIQAALTVVAGLAAGLVLQVTNTTAGATSELCRYVVAAAGDGWHGFRVSGDTANRIILDTTVAGLTRIRLGSGVGAPDVVLERLAANVLGLVTADLAVNSAGRGLQVKEGANAKQGTAILAAGSVVVANTAVTASSRIFLGFVTPSANAGALFCSSVIVGTGFTIKSTNAADTSTVAYEIFEAAP